MSSIGRRTSFDPNPTPIVGGSSQQVQSQGTESRRNSVDEPHGETPHGLRSRSREPSLERHERGESSTRPQGRRRHTQFEIGSSSTTPAFGPFTGFTSADHLPDLASSSRPQGTRTSRRRERSGAPELHRQHDELVRNRQDVATEHEQASRSLDLVGQRLSYLGERRSDADSELKTATQNKGKAELQQQQAQRNLGEVQSSTQKALADQQARVREATGQAGAAVEAQGRVERDVEHATSRLENTRRQLRELGTEIGTLEQERTRLRGELGLDGARQSPSSSSATAGQAQVQGEAAAATSRPATPAAEPRAEGTRAQQPAVQGEQPATAGSELRANQAQQRADLDAVETKLETLRGRHAELSAEEPRQQQTLEGEKGKLQLAKEAVKSTAETAGAATARLEQMQTEAEGKVKEAKSQLQTANELVQRRSGELSEAQKALGSVTSEIKKTQKQQQQLTSEVGRLETRLSELDGRIDTVRASLEQQAERSPRTSVHQQLLRSHPLLGGGQRRRSETALPRAFPTDRRPSEHDLALRFIPATPSEHSLSHGVRGSGASSPLGHDEGIERLSVPKAGSTYSSAQASAGSSALDVPHSGHVNVETRDGEAFALREDGTLYMRDNASGKFNAELLDVRQLKLGANYHAYALHASGTIFALTEQKDQSNGIAARELPLPNGGQLVDFTVSPSGSVPYIVQTRNADGGEDSAREVYWLPHGKDQPMKLPLPPTMGPAAGVGCSPNGEVYLLDHNGEMWRGRPDDVLAKSEGKTEAVGWRRLDVPDSMAKAVEITTLPKGEIQVSTAARDDWPADTPGLGPDNRLHFVLSKKDEWKPHEQMTVDVLDLAYRDRLKNQAANRKGGVTLGIGAGKRSGWEHEEHPSLAVRYTRPITDYLSNQLNRMSPTARAVTGAVGEMAVSAAIGYATGRALGLAGRAAWLARPVGALVPTMIRNRKMFHASPPPIQLPGLDQKPAQSRGGRWANFFRAVYTPHTEREALNAALRKELAVGLKLMQRPNSSIPAPPSGGGADHYAEIRGDMVNRLITNAQTALNRIEKELGTIDAHGQPVAPNVYQNNDLYKRFRFDAPGTIKGAVTNAPRQVNDTNNVLYQLHRQAEELLRNTGSAQAQALVDRLHDLMHVKQVYIPAQDTTGEKVKDLSGWGGRDTTHAFFTMQLHKMASDLGHTFKAVQTVQQKLATAPDGDAAALARNSEVARGMVQEAAAHMDADSNGRVNTDFRRYESLRDYATQTDPAVVEKQLAKELHDLRSMPADVRLSKLNGPEFEQLRKTYHDNTKQAVEQLYDALGLNGMYAEFQSKGAVPETSKDAPYRQLQQTDQQLVWGSKNALFDLYKRRMVTLHGVPPDEVQPPAAAPAGHTRGDIPLVERVPVHEPREDGELTARIEFLLRQGIFMPATDAVADSSPGKLTKAGPRLTTKPMIPNAAPVPFVAGAKQMAPTPAANKAPHPDVQAPQSTMERARNFFSQFRKTVVDSGLDVVLGQLTRCQLVAEQAAHEVAQKSRAAAQVRPAGDTGGPSTATTVQRDTIETVPREGTAAATLPSEVLADVATRSQAKIKGSTDNPAGMLFEKGLLTSKAMRLLEKLRVQQMISSHPDHLVTRAVNMQGTIHPEDVQAFAEMAWRSMPTGTTIRLDHTLHLGVDFDGLGFSFRFVNRQLQGVPEVPGPDSSKNVLNIPLNSLFSFQPTPYFGHTSGSSVSVTKTTTGTKISMSNFTDNEAKLLAGKLMWGAGRFGANQARASDGSLSHTILALIYWGLEGIPNALKVSSRGTNQLDFELDNNDSGIAEAAAVNLLSGKASADHLLEVSAKLVESHKDTKSREHEFGAHPLAASVMIANGADDRNLRFKGVAAGLIQAALTGTYSSDVEVREGDGKIRTTTTAKRKSTTVVVKPIEVTELQLSKQWPWQSPVPINGVRPEVGDGVEMEWKVPTWIRVGIINVFQKNGLAAGVTTAPDGKVEGVSWGATTRHEFEKFPQLEQLRLKSPKAYNNMMKIAQEAEKANTPINVNLELKPDALARLNSTTNEAEATAILKDQNSYQIKSVSASEEYKYDSGTFFGFFFGRMDHKASNTFSNPMRGMVEVVYPKNDEEAIEVKVRGEWTIGGGKADFASLDARRQNVEVENAILNVAASKERMLMAMVLPGRVEASTVRAATYAMDDTSRADKHQDHVAMHNGRLVLRTWAEGEWRQASLSAHEVNALLLHGPHAPSRPTSQDGTQALRDGSARQGSDVQAWTNASDRSTNASPARSREVAEEWRDEFNAEKEELKQSGKVKWSQDVLHAMSAGASVAFGHDPRALLGAEAVNALKSAAAPDPTPANARLDPVKPVYVGDIIRAMHEAGGRTAYALDAAQEHVLATYFPAADGGINHAVVDAVLATDADSFINAADIVAGRVKPALLARIDVPEVAAAPATAAPAPVPGVPVLGGISAGGA